MEEGAVDLTLKPGNTATSRRREKRRERILRNSDQRIRTILNGPGGTEIKNAPALEGGEGFRNLIHSTRTSTRDTTTSESITLPFFSCAPLSRFWKTLFVGLIMRLAVSLLLIQNVVWPWIVVYVISVSKRFFQFSSKYDDSHFFYSKQRLGLNIAVLSRTGVIVQNMWYFIKESLVVALSFILFNALFCAFTVIVSKCYFL